MLREGVHQIGFDEYLSDPAPEPSLSAHIAHTILTRSPAHAWQQHARLNPKYEPEESKRLDFGSAAHEVLLCGNVDKRVRLFNPEEYPNAKGPGVATGWTNKAIKAARDACKAEGNIPVLIGDWVIVKQMVEAAKNFIEHTSLRGCFESGKAEQTLIWHEGETWCRGRPDLMTDEAIIDYKSTTNARPEYVIRALLGQMGYDIQAAFYTHGAFRLSEYGTHAHDHAKDFIFLFQENESPFSCSLIGMEPSFIHAANVKVEAAIGIWSECLRTNRWPGYAHDIHYAEPPAWMMAEAERYL